MDKIECSDYEFQYLLIQSIVFNDHIGNIEAACNDLTILKANYSNMYLILLKNQTNLKSICEE